MDFCFCLPAFLIERFFSSITTLHSLTQCSTYNSTPPLESGLQALYLNQIPRSKKFKISRFCYYFPAYLIERSFHPTAAFLIDFSSLVPEAQGAQVSQINTDFLDADFEVCGFLTWPAGVLSFVC